MISNNGSCKLGEVNSVIQTKEVKEKGIMHGKPQNVRNYLIK